MADYSLVEQETLIRWDRTDALAMLYTAAPREAERWRKLGYTVDPVGAHGWQAQIPKTAVRLRKLVMGAVVKRPVSEAFLAAARRTRKTRTGV